MCQFNMTTTNPVALSLPSPCEKSSSCSSCSSNDCKPNNGLRVLLCSESVPPQVNGIARRIGIYADGLKDLGCNVDFLHPDSDGVFSYMNPYNFSSKMMIIKPLQMLKLFTRPYDIVHVVMPCNLSGMWLLAGFKLFRSIRGDSKPALVVSWHCNIYDYILHFATGLLRPLRELSLLSFYFLFAMLPFVSDRILTPTRTTEPELVRYWDRSSGKSCTGVCYTGVNKAHFSPDTKGSKWGRTWQVMKDKFLAQENCEHLIVCVGRLSPEKGVDELIKKMGALPGCALWLVGDGPSQLELERLARKLNVPVKFLGYQGGEALHSVYAVADLFVCPSLTETFGQTVNEAIASNVRVALPSVPVFVEAFGDVIPGDAFWEPLNREDMVKTILKQIDRHEMKDDVGLPDLKKLKSWEDACESLYGEYVEAAQDQQHSCFALLAGILFPFWWAFTFGYSVFFCLLSKFRIMCGGAEVLFIMTVTEKVVRKVNTWREVLSFNKLDQKVDAAENDQV